MPGKDRAFTHMPTFNFDGSFILAVIMAVVGWVTTLVNIKIKTDVQKVKAEVDRANFELEQKLGAQNNALENRISTKLDELTLRLSQNFVPANVEAERRSAISQSLARFERDLEFMERRAEKDKVDLEREITRNRDAIHRWANETMPGYQAHVANLTEKLLEKTERVSQLTTTVANLDRRIDSMQDDIDELNRHRA